MADLLSAADRLPGFLHEQAGAPFVFGESDCSMFLANWVRRLKGVDPAGELRGAYGDEAGWRALVDAAGGLDVLVGRIAAVSALPAIAPAAACEGDIGVVAIPALDLTAGAICVRNGRPRPDLADGLSTAWVTKLHRGLTRLRCRPLAAWSLA